ncbi:MULTISPECIES: TnsA endonuclease N-terminal domain-containing protein [unclassified Methylobacterium]|uniref:TnsA endonuclease N-terminal domain-containing protein n=1 Tax=unclassified Methylobacterium TaxID=2615210 RepID=UPI0037001C5E
MARRGHQVGRRKATRTVVPYGGRDGYRVEIPVYRVGGQVVDCESLLEGDFVTIVEAYDRDLVEIQEQPLALRIFFEGRFRTWTPDFLLRLRGKRPELVEVKTLEALYPEDDADAARVEGWWCAVEEAARRKGFDFSLQTEHEIRIQPLLWNAKLLGRYADDLFPDRLVRAGREALLALPEETTVADLQEAVGSGVEAFPLAIRLDWLGHVEIDRTERFSASARMRRL